MEGGWIKLHRCLLDKAIWMCSTPEQRCVLITILLLANHEPKQWIWNGNKYQVGAGQLITSLSSLAKKSDVSIQNVRSALNKFEKLEFLTSESTKTGRLITIINWGNYQLFTEKPNKEPTKSQQRTNKEPTTNKNDNNDKNDKNNKESRFTPPTIDEVKAYCQERKNGIDPETFVDFYSSKGWKIGKDTMKDWKAAVRTWERRDKKDNPDMPEKKDVSKLKALEAYYLQEEVE